MEPASPARLYAAVAGALLVLLGVLGFFYAASFGGSASVEPALGVLRVNGWLNLLYLLTGALGLAMAGGSSRGYARAAGLLFTALAIWGFALGGGGPILGFLPAGGGDEALHLALGLLGLAAAAGTPKAARRGLGAGRREGAPGRRRGSKARAEAAGEGA